MNDKTIVITAGTTGIGFVCAKYKREVHNDRRLVYQYWDF